MSLCRKPRRFKRDFYGDNRLSSSGRAAFMSGLIWGTPRPPGYVGKMLDSHRRALVGRNSAFTNSYSRSNALVF